MSKQRTSNQEGNNNQPPPPASYATKLRDSVNLGQAKATDSFLNTSMNENKKGKKEIQKVNIGNKKIELFQQLAKTHGVDHVQVVEPTSGSKVTKINTSMAGNTGAGPLDRNTPTIQGQSENPNKVEMTVAEDGTTTVGNYKLGRDLGKGTFGKVKVGTHQLSGEKVAIKVLEKDKIQDVNDVERVAREIQILKMVRHPVVVQLYEIIETQKELYLIMEYARGGELFEYIVNNKRVREKVAAKFLHQIISGIEYMHKLGICHRDLKPENLLMDDYNNIKIVDFGLSNTYRPGQTLKTACGSPCYAAPEMVAGKQYHGLPADIWSCGVILYAMVCGYLPFEDPKTNVLYKKILNADYTIPEFVSDDCKDLIKRILNTDPIRRFTVADIKNHVWYKQIKNCKDYSGIIIGTNPIPVDMERLEDVLSRFSFDSSSTAQGKRQVEMNRHNGLTTAYYLCLKKFIRQGGKSIADITNYNPERMELMLQNEHMKQQEASSQQQQYVKQIQIRSKSKADRTDEKSAANKQEGSQKEQNQQANGVVAVATIMPHGKPAKEAQASSNTTFAAPIQENSPIFPKQQRAMTQERGNGSKNGKPNNLTQNVQPVVLLQQAAPRNQTSCNNRSTAAKEAVKTEASEGFNSVIIGTDEKQGPGISQLARNGNQFASTGNYKGGIQENVITMGQGGGGGLGSHQVSQIEATSSGLATAASGRGHRYRSNNIPTGNELMQINQHPNVQLSNQQYQISKNGRMNKSPSPHEFFRQKQAQKNLVLTSSNASQYASGGGNAMANDTFEQAQRQIQNQRKMMQMTQTSFMHGQQLDTPLVAGRATANSPIQMIPSKLTRKQILQMQLANQQQLPQVDAVRKKPKTGSQYAHAQQAVQQQQFQSSSGNMAQAQMIFQGDQFSGQKVISPANIANGDIHYMYFTPRDVINLQHQKQRTQNINLTGHNSIMSSQQPQSTASPSMQQTANFTNGVRLSTQAGNSRPRQPQYIIQNTTKTNSFLGSQTQEKASPRRSSQTHQIISSGLPVSTTTGSNSTMSRRRGKLPSQLVPSTQSGLTFSNNQQQQIVEWATQAQQQNNSKQRVPKNQINPLNSTHVNLSYKRSHQQQQSPPHSQQQHMANRNGLQNFMHKVPPHQQNQISQASHNAEEEPDKQQLSRSMNVSNILNQSLDPQRLKNNLIQSTEAPSKLRDKPHFDKRTAHQLNNNYIDSNPNGSQAAAYLLAAAQPTNTSKQQALKKKHFQFQHQQNQFEHFMNQTQPLTGQSQQYSLPLSAYDLTQINLNAQGNVTSSTKQGQQPQTQNLQQQQQQSQQHQRLRNRVSVHQPSNSLGMHIQNTSNLGGQPKPQKTAQGGRRSDQRAQANQSYDATPINVINNSLNITIYNNNPSPNPAPAQNMTHTRQMTQGGYHSQLSNQNQRQPPKDQFTSGNRAATVLGQFNTNPNKVAANVEDSKQLGQRSRQQSIISPNNNLQTQYQIFQQQPKNATQPQLGQAVQKLKQTKQHSSNN